MAGCSALGHLDVVVICEVSMVVVIVDMVVMGLVSESVVWSSEVLARVG